MNDRPPESKEARPEEAAGREFRYWRWLFLGLHDRAGILAFLDGWLVVHALVGSGLAFYVPLTLSEAASRVLLPLVGALIGLCFAWSGNAAALLQTSQIARMAERTPDGQPGYVFAFQNAILVVLGCVGLWGLAALEIFDKVLPYPRNSRVYGAIGTILYGLSSVALRECWQVVLNTQRLLISRERIRRADAVRGGASRDE